MIDQYNSRAGGADGTEGAGNGDPTVTTGTLPMQNQMPVRLERFYDRLRARLAAGLGERGRLSHRATDALLVVPDVFVLLARMSVDRDVPRTSRHLVAASLAYFLVPADLMPEMFVGVGGFLDDLVLAAGVLTHVMTGDLEPVARRHWSGSRELADVVRDLAATGHALLGRDLYGRVRGLLARRGVRL